jgi:polyisoprenoid-binding protein YceI
MPFQIDPVHSHIQFSVRHMMISKARGTFDKWSGTIALDPEHPELTTVEITIQTDSINTKDSQRDGHLKSPDFFAVEQYPVMHFKSTRVEVTGKESAKLYGDLTIRDVTNPVVVDVEYQGSSKTPWGTTLYGFNGSTKINREDWGLTWNAALETGGWVLGKDVQIEIELELAQVAEFAPQAA